MATANTAFAAAGRLIVKGAKLDDNDPIIAGRELLFDFDAAEAQPTKAPRGRKAAE